MIIASNSGTKRELIPAGNYVARCYQMIEMGTITENIMGKSVTVSKIRIGWELPTELKVFSEEKGEQPLVISKDYNLSMNEKSNLRKMLASWRGKDFSEDEAKAFDVTKLLGVPCMLNIIHKASKADATKIYEDIGSISPVPKGLTVPAPMNSLFVLSYDDFSAAKFDSLPDFIKDKMKTSLEFVAMQTPNSKHMNHTTEGENFNSEDDDLPF